MPDRALTTRAMTTIRTTAFVRPSDDLPAPHAVDLALFTDHAPADPIGPTPPHRSRS